MDMPLIADAARSPTVALMISMALAAAVAAADSSVTPASGDASSRRASSRAVHAERTVAAHGIDHRHDDSEDDE
jgi:hypothetical protein